MFKISSICKTPGVFQDPLYRDHRSVDSPKNL